MPSSSPCGWPSSAHWAKAITAASRVAQHALGMIGRLLGVSVERFTSRTENCANVIDEDTA